MGHSDKTDSASSRKIGLSCAECRRSKLKCDRTFPCQSCIRRGCSSICPDGILPATKGNKVLMAHAQDLSKQVKQMTARLRELEELLETQAPHLLTASKTGKYKVEPIDTHMDTSSPGPELHLPHVPPPPIAAPTLSNGPMLSNGSLLPNRIPEHLHPTGQRLPNGPAPAMSAPAMSAMAPGHVSLHHIEQHQQQRQEEDDEQETKELADGIGSLAIGQDGQMRYRGVTAGAEYLQDLLPSTYDESKYRLKDLGFPPEITELAIAFPFGLKESSHKKPLLVPFLPTKERALELFDIYYEYCSWMYNPITRDAFIRTFVNPIYGTTGIPSVHSVHSHKLSVFFITLANGALYDEASGERAHFNAARYHQLARAAMSVDSILTDASVATCEALFMMIRFIYNSDRSTNEERWLITGLAARTAQMIGLQRDSGGWSLPEEEIQRRRCIFWDIWTWDTFTAIVNGRPGCLTLTHTECKLGEDEFAVFTSRILPPEPGYQMWRTLYCIACLTASADHVFAIKTPPYSQLLALDKMLRSMCPPNYLQTPDDPRNPDNWPNDSKLACEMAAARFMKESNALYIHRSYFAQAIRQRPDQPFSHKFAPSVYAVITSARTICMHLHGLYAKHPKIVRHGWFFWTSMYSSCIVLSALIVECPGFSLAINCYQDLRSALDLYEEGSRPCRSEASLRHIQQLVERAAHALDEYRQGRGERVSKTADPSQPDALDVLGGRKTLIVPKSNNNSPTSNNSNPTPPSATQPTIITPIPVNPHAGAAEMFMEFVQNNDGFERNKYEAYYSQAQQHNYMAAQALAHTQALQSISSTQASAYSSYLPTPEAFSTQQQQQHQHHHQPTHPNTILSPSEGYPTPSEPIYSPQFENPLVFNNNNNSDNGSAHPSNQHISHQHNSNQQQWHGNYPPTSPPAFNAQSPYNGPSNGHSITLNHPMTGQQSQVPFRPPGVDLSQSQIWNNFAQDFYM